MKVLAAAALAWIASAALLAQSSPSPAKPAAAAPARQAPAATPLAASAATYRTWVNKYCVGCHSSRNPQPGNDPVNLESASLDDLLPHAATWERVLRKLSVRAMPPQGTPHPTEPEYVAFTAWRWRRGAARPP